MIEHTRLLVRVSSPLTPILPRSPLSPQKVKHAISHLQGGEREGIWYLSNVEKRHPGIMEY